MLLPQSLDLCWAACPGEPRVRAGLRMQSSAYPAWKCHCQTHVTAIPQVRASKRGDMRGRGSQSLPGKVTPLTKVGKDLQDHLCSHQPRTTKFAPKPPPQVPFSAVCGSAPKGGCKDKDSASSTFSPAGSATPREGTSPARSLSWSVSQQGWGCTGGGWRSCWAPRGEPLELLCDGFIGVFR